ncbi:hypothetical protein SDC9_138888 [bioreactor metagenome]|uniref:Xylose isomerase-like TIM barrel domain-containing protein n=1 Tax=bioreactor metagenome TaxID=1076179 RepID=A0A645DQL7_9ZZZZ
MGTVDLSGTHVNYDEPGNWPTVVESYRKAGVRLPGIGVVYARPDETWNRRFFDFAREAEARLVSFSLPPDGHEETLRGMERLSEEYGIRIAIHNHGGYDWLGSRAMLDYVFKHHPSVGLCLDTAWCIQAGEDPVKWLELFGGRLAGIHFKDFRFDPAGKWHDTAVGEGALDLPAFLARFRALEFSGPAVVEYEGENPEEYTARSVANIRACLA